jgi:predicted nucleotidyltransferase
LKSKSFKEDKSDLRQKVAIEAATLLYFGSEKEYKQAKLKAAENFGARILPSNSEIALELNNIAEANEGSARNDRLMLMRTEALEIMKTIVKYNPVLIGSVWRGTIRRGSDIDIEVFYEDPDQIVSLLRADGLEINKTERIAATENKETQISFHIHAISYSKKAVEIVVRNPEQRSRKRKCDTFGDDIKGLKIKELEKLLKDNPLKKFIPC